MRPEGKENFELEVFHATLKYFALLYMYFQLPLSYFQLLQLLWYYDNLYGCTYSIFSSSIYVRVRSFCSRITGSLMFISFLLPIYMCFVCFPLFYPIYMCSACSSFFLPIHMYFGITLLYPLLMYNTVYDILLVCPLTQ